MFFCLFVFSSKKNGIDKDVLWIETAGLLIEAGGSHDDFRHLVRIGIGRRTSVFEVALSLFGNRTRHANTAAAIGNACFVSWPEKTLKTRQRGAQQKRNSPAEKSWIDDVSQRPVKRRSLSLPSWGSYALMCFTWHFDSFSMAFSISLQKKTPQVKTGAVEGFRRSTTYAMPPSSLMAFVEKLQWAPAPFHSPFIGFGSSDTFTPKSSATRCKMYLAIHRSSPMVMPSQGPTWNSHYFR